ncbi:MAG: O-antigen ligase family protein, partial [Gemmataceae bacterium]|nr:O-antigen ligase family protein [Gemmataceae bacterium]
MTKHRRSVAATVSTENPSLARRASVENPTPVSDPDRLRRLMLMLLTAILVARPIVFGEDPGLVADVSSPGGQTLTLFVFLVAAGWAAWHVASGRGGFTFSPVEWPLLVVVLCTFLSAEAAVYKHPARLIAWEWLGLFVIFVLVRRMPLSPSEQYGLLAALLATTVALSAQAVYQCAYEYPRLAASVGGSAERLGEALSRISSDVDTSDQRFIETIRQRLQDAFATATFAHPNSFAGFLVLFLPGLVGAALVARWKAQRHGVWLWVFAALTAAALVLSHSRGAFAAVVLVGLVVATIWWRRWLWARRGWVAAGVLALAVIGLAVQKSGLLARLFAKESSGGMSARLEYWRTTAAIIGAHPWLGVGPGNFRGAYQRHMDEGMGEQVLEPHNFVLEIWATSGLVAVVAVLVALALVGLALVRRHNVGSLSSSGPLTTHHSPPWVFFAGGAIGIALSFALRVQWQEPNIDEGVSAALRIAVWLPAMAVLIRVPWTSGTCLVVLAAGAAAHLLNLSLSGGIAFFSVATPFWAVLALSLNLVEP